MEVTAEEEKHLNVAASESVLYESCNGEERNSGSMSAVQSDLGVLYEEDRELWRVLMMMISRTWHLDDKVESLRAQLNQQQADALIHRLHKSQHSSLTREVKRNTNLRNNAKSHHREACYKVDSATLNGSSKRDENNHHVINTISSHVPENLPQFTAAFGTYPQRKPSAGETFEERSGSIKRTGYDFSELKVPHPCELNRRGIELSSDRHNSQGQDFPTESNLSLTEKAECWSSHGSSQHLISGSLHHRDLKTDKPDRLFPGESQKASYHENSHSQTHNRKVTPAHYNDVEKPKSAIGYINHCFYCPEVGEYGISDDRVTTQNSHTQTDAIIMARQAAYHNGPTRKYSQPQKAASWSCCCF